ncbi:hypothetical protein LTR78_001921 [Recurvomyces mirabilis]|uniref:Uncharacterized protein n=1 Tax=Recurvomyces mirabilis TaxID=574656 RepID=A0AAE0WVH9_9PEZI|nr:hypothetical protein LTR78_001921 [Recurvomyces mirabilis]KAK5156640.1 hypothetical protein LTS14_004852 [Recurvomyces mirabilis]
MKFFAHPTSSSNNPAPSSRPSASHSSPRQTIDPLSFNSDVQPPNPAGTGGHNVGNSTYYNQPLPIYAAGLESPCLATTKTPLNYAHGPRKSHQDGPLYGYEAHASLLRGKLAAYIADLKRLTYEWDNAARLLDRARRELDLLDGDERRSRTFSAEQRAWKKEREGWLADFGWAEGRVRRVKGEVGRKGYRGFGDEVLE